MRSATGSGRGVGTPTPAVTTTAGHRRATRPRSFIQLALPASELMLPPVPRAIALNTILPPAKRSFPPRRTCLIAIESALPAGSESGPRRWPAIAAPMAALRADPGVIHAIGPPLAGTKAGGSRGIAVASTFHAPVTLPAHGRALATLPPTGTFLVRPPTTGARSGANVLIGSGIRGRAPPPGSAPNCVRRRIFIHPPWTPSPPKASRREIRIRVRRLDRGGFSCG